MADDFPDFHHKLSKKLATLITVFYHLNTKNDENDHIQKNVIQAYEDEMDKIVQSANEIIDKHIKDNAQKLELYEIRNAYQAFKSKIEEERDLSIKQFNDFKEVALKKEKALEEEAQIKLNNYQTEVEDLKEKIWQMQKVLEKMIGSEIKFDEEERQKREIESQRIKKELDEKTKEAGELRMKYLELERLYKELEEAYFMTDRMENQGDSNNGIRPDEWENEMLRRRVLEQERVIGVLKRRSGHGNGLLDGEVASIEIGESNPDNSNLSLRVSNLQKEKMVSDLLLQEKNSEIEKLKERLKENITEEKFQKKIDEYENRLKEAAREHRKLIETLHSEYNENMNELEAEFERETMRLQSILQGMQTTLEARNEYIAGLEDKLRSMESLRENMEEELQALKDARETEVPLAEEVERLKKLLEDAKAKQDEDRRKAEEESAHLREELKKDKDKSLSALREELTQLKNSSEAQKDKRIKELEEELEKFKKSPQQELEKKTSQMAEDYQNKLNDLSTRHNVMMKETMGKYEEKMDLLKKRYEKEINDLKKELEQEKENVLKMKDEDKMSEVTQVKKDYEAKLQKISKSYDLQLEEKLHEFENRLKKKDTEINDLRDEIDRIKRELTIKMEKIGQKDSEKKNLEKIIKEQKNKIESLQEEIEGKFLEGENSDNLRGELSKIKEGGYDKTQQELLANHLKYTEKMERKLKELKRQMDDKTQILTERYQDLLEAFEQRPSRIEDLALIKQQEDELRKMNEALRTSPSENKTSGFHSHPGLNTTSMKKNGKMPPPPINSSLPPIAIIQAQMNHRTPPGATLTKKFFK